MKAKQRNIFWGISIVAILIIVVGLLNYSLSRNKPIKDIDKKVGIDETLKELEEKVIPNIRLTTWERLKFDGKAEYFSAQDLEKAQKILSKYFDNFSKIENIKLKMTQKIKILGDKIAPQSYIEQLPPGMTLNVEIIRSPIYIKLEGYADNLEIKEIVTPMGEISSGYFGRSASLLSEYLYGEKWFLEYSLLKYGDKVQENMTMDKHLPYMESLIQAKKIEDTKYDVIEDIKDDIKQSNTYWFNKTTGMLDFIIERHLQTEENKNPFYGAAVLDYYNIDGIYYLKNATHFYYDENYDAKREIKITDLKINREIP